MTEFLHERRDFAQLIAIVAEQRGIDPVLVEKDYWIMHCLWSLQAQGFRFELKGGTSLSKGFGVNQIDFIPHPSAPTRRRCASRFKNAEPYCRSAAARQWALPSTQKTIWMAW